MAVTIAKNPKRIRTFIERDGTVTDKTEALARYKKTNMGARGGGPTIRRGEAKKDAS